MKRIDSFKKQDLFYFSVCKQMIIWNKIMCHIATIETVCKQMIFMQENYSC